MGVTPVIFGIRSPDQLHAPDVQTPMAEATRELQQKDWVFFNTSHLFEGLKNANIIKHFQIRYGNLWHISGSEKKTSGPHLPKQGSRQKRISSKCCVGGLARSASAAQILLA